MSQAPRMAVSACGLVLLWMSGVERVAAVPSVLEPDAVFINEIHYDNIGADLDEGVELIGPPGESLSGWHLALINGASGRVYREVALADRLLSSEGPVGAVFIPISGMQNGAPDGIALFDPMGEVTEFLSYEGEIVAHDALLAGLLSTDLGVSEPSTTPLGLSLQRVGV